MAEYNWTLRKEGKEYEVQIDEAAKYGSFEHNTLGEDSAGGLWFNDQKELVDADGTYCVPPEVIEIVRGFGYTVSDDFGCE